MSREILILWAGRHRRDRWEDLASVYRGRLERSLRIHDRPIKSSRQGSDGERRKREGRLLIEALPNDFWTIALDAGGEMLDSVEFSKLVGSLIDEWQHPTAFVLGSDVGLSQAVLEQARTVLSLGPMTLPHELARLVLYEQLYRAIAIRAGINYHR